MQRSLIASDTLSPLVIFNVLIFRSFYRKRLSWSKSNVFLISLSVVCGEVGGGVGGAPFQPSVSPPRTIACIARGPLPFSPATVEQRSIRHSRVLSTPRATSSNSCSSSAVIAATTIPCRGQGGYVSWEATWASWSLERASVPGVWKGINAPPPSSPPARAHHKARCHRAAYPKWAWLRGAVGHDVCVCVGISRIKRIRSQAIACASLLAHWLPHEHWDPERITTGGENDNIWPSTVAATRGSDST